MASLYYRGDAIWINYKSEDGTWKNKNTGYRKSNPGERFQAERARDTQTLKEKLAHPVRRTTGGWEWVAPWIYTTWAHSPRTQDTYQKYWRLLSRWLTAKDLRSPINVTRPYCLDYPNWRLTEGGRRNTSIHELKFLKQVMDEAFAQHMVSSPVNPASKLGLGFEEKGEYAEWSVEEMDRVERELEENDPHGWMRCTFLLGRYQAVRLMQARVPLACIDLAGGNITYPPNIVKGGKGYSQRLDPKLIPALKEIVEYRRGIGATVLCEMPAFPSLDWRAFLNKLGYPHIVHHGLRVSWISNAARKGVTEFNAMKFSNHDSVGVHRIYMHVRPGDMDDMFALLR
jgi:hypothetical protein